MITKKILIGSLLTFLCSAMSLAQGTITYNLDGGTTTNPTSYEQVDITTTVTIADYSLLMNGTYSEKPNSEDLVYLTGIQCQTWSRTQESGTVNYNAATDVSYNLENASITWTEFGPDPSQSSIESTCAAGLMGVTKTVVDGEYLIQEQGAGDPFYLGIRSVEFSTITLMEATKEGYTFEGWFTEAEFTNSITEIKDGTTGDIEIFAKFTENASGILATSARNFKFYPNPSIDFINTEIKVSNLTVLNSIGIKVLEFNNNQDSYDISSLDAGIYFLKASDKEGVLHISKLIKE